jgi:hypothetical protein
MLTCRAGKFEFPVLIFPVLIFPILIGNQNRAGGRVR